MVGGNIIRLYYLPVDNICEKMQEIYNLCNYYIQIL
jgi:hypothetical protein